MYNKFIQENLFLIMDSLILIEKRFLKIKEAEDFVSNEAGVFVLDAITMRLQVVGESLKKINKIEKSFLKKYPAIEWESIMRLRDIVSHHYEKVDHDIIFDICKHHLSDLRVTIVEMIESNSS